MSRYIKANIAIHTDDPWFWQKLRSVLLNQFEIKHLICEHTISLKNTLENFIINFPRYALPRKRSREKVRSPSCETASTIASIPYVPQISKEGLLREEFVT